MSSIRGDERERQWWDVGLNNVEDVIGSVEHSPQAGLVLISREQIGVARDCFGCGRTVSFQ